MGRIAAAFPSAAIAYMGMDMGWLTLTESRIYRPVIGPLLADRPNLSPAFAFYLIYVGGLVGFAVRPALAVRDWRRAAMSGAGLGLVAYATYDLTNQATLRLWSTGISVVDVCWGALASAVAATIGYLAAMRIAPAPGRQT